MVTCLFGLLSFSISCVFFTKCLCKWEKKFVRWQLALLGYHILDYYLFKFLFGLLQWNLCVKWKTYLSSWVEIFSWSRMLDVSKLCHLLMKIVTFCISLLLTTFDICFMLALSFSFYACDRIQLIICVPSMNPCPWFSEILHTHVYVTQHAQHPYL